MDSVSLEDQLAHFVHCPLKRPTPYYCQPLCPTFFHRIGPISLLSSEIRVVCEYIVCVVCARSNNEPTARTPQHSLESGNQICPYLGVGISPGDQLCRHPPETAGPAFGCCPARAQPIDPLKPPGSV